MQGGRDGVQDRTSAFVTGLRSTGRALGRDGDHEPDGRRGRLLLRPVRSDAFNGFRSSGGGGAGECFAAEGTTPRSKPGDRSAGPTTIHEVSLTAPAGGRERSCDHDRHSMLGRTHRRLGRARTSQCGICPGTPAEGLVARRSSLEIAEDIADRQPPAEARDARSGRSRDASTTPAAGEGSAFSSMRCHEPSAADDF